MLDKTRCAAILRFTQNAAKLHQRQRFSRIDYPCTRLLRLQGRRGGAITEAVDDFLRPLVAGAQKRGESAKRAWHPLPEVVSGSSRQHLRGQIPELAVELDVASDGADPARAGHATRYRAPGEASTEQVLLAAVIDAPEVISDVLGAPAGEELRGLHPALCGLWEAQRQRPLGKGQLLVLEEPPLLHALDLNCEALEALGH